MHIMWDGAHLCGCGGRCLNSALASDGWDYGLNDGCLDVEVSRTRANLTVDAALVLGQPSLAHLSSRATRGVALFASTNLDGLLCQNCRSTHILNHRTRLSSRGLTGIYRQTLKRKNQGHIFYTTGSRAIGLN